MAIAWLNGVEDDELRNAMASFTGAQRRFDFYLKNDDIVLRSEEGRVGKGGEE